MKPEIELGNEVKCTVTGFTGIATAKCVYLNGCVQFGVSPKVDKEGKMPDTQYIDHRQVEYVGEGVKMKPIGSGGPQNHPK